MQNGKQPGTMYSQILAAEQTACRAIHSEVAPDENGARDLSFLRTGVVSLLILSAFLPGVEVFSD